MNIFLLLIIMTFSIVEFNYYRYNIFVSANILSKSPEEQISGFIALLAQPVRVQILLVIADQEACVCHLETIIGIRQARISQHLMKLRKAGLVNTIRAGRHVYYRLSNPEIVNLLYQIAELIGIDSAGLREIANRSNANCTCPRCKPDADPKLVCSPR
jgi:ArsR family transcriptional regulator